jgi:hypothetical protein
VCRDIKSDLAEMSSLSSVGRRSLTSVLGRRHVLVHARRYTVEAPLLETKALLLQPDAARPHPVSDAGRESTSMRGVNTTVRALSGSFTRSEPIAFFCECHDPTCFGAVWMTPATFDATISGHTSWMLLEGHEPSALWHTRELRPTPATRRAPCVLSDTDDTAPRPITKSRTARLDHRLARAS